MSLTRINSNVGSLAGQHNLKLNAERMAKSIERLSSGYRINTGADDPSGLVIAELLKAQVGGMAQAQENVAQAANLVKTSEGALSEVSNLLQQMRNKAVSAASDSTNNANSRQALQNQVASALNTINQIANTTKYAGRNLLDGTAGTQVANNNITDVARATLNSTAGAGAAAINITQVATKASQDTTNAYAAVTDTVDNAGAISINGEAIYVDAADTVQDVIDNINAKRDKTGVLASWDAVNTVVQLDQQNYGSTNTIAYSETADILNGGVDINAAGANAQATVTWGDATTSTFNTANGSRGLAMLDNHGNSIVLTDAGNVLGNKAGALTVTQGELSFQIGMEANETSGISLNSVNTADLGITAALANVDISTVSGANAALGVIDEAITQVSTQRGNLGAFLTNELQAQGRALAVQQQNLTASESQIRNTDFGAEMSEFTTSQILVQSATAFLAQANSMPQMVLQLIKG